MPRNIAWPEANSRSAFEKPEPEILLFGPNTIARLKAARLGQVRVLKIGKGTPTQVSFHIAKCALQK
jgi:hypothetical protein